MSRAGMSHKPIDPQSSIEMMWKIAPRFAAARATRVYLEEYRKSLKAILMKASQAKTSVAQEADAYADKSYIEHLGALRIAVEEEESLRWKLVTCQAAVEVYRTMEASNRAIDRSTR
jgi:hypothetical protein